MTENTNGSADARKDHVEQASDSNDHEKDLVSKMDADLEGGERSGDAHDRDHSQDATPAKMDEKLDSSVPDALQDADHGETTRINYSDIMNTGRRSEEGLELRIGDKDAQQLEDLKSHRSLSEGEQRYETTLGMSTQNRALGALNEALKAVDPSTDEPLDNEIKRLEEKTGKAKHTDLYGTIDKDGRVVPPVEPEDK